jgi:hypothetical protein
MRADGDDLDAGDGLRALLDAVAAGEVSPSDAQTRLAGTGFVDLGFARVDVGRARRRGVPEVVFGQGKTAEQIVGVAQALASRGQQVLITRVDPDTFAALGALSDLPFQYEAEARCVVLADAPPPVTGRGPVLVITAGTTDGPVAAEAALTARMCGSPVERLDDVGVAGLHRLLAALPQLRRAEVLVVCAGLEAALASVVTGLVDRPVIAVPTSVGYGASFGGVAALLGMLNVCAAGVTVVNIDNGFGAGYAAALMNRRRDEP